MGCQEMALDSMPLNSVKPMILDNIYTGDIKHCLVVEVLEIAWK